MDNQVISKINEFFRAALKCYGNEVGLYSNQYFGIDKICGANIPESESRYVVQYGFPQSGCVFLNFSYNKGINEFALTDISVYAPDDSHELVVANLDVKTEVMEELTSEIKLGADMQTSEFVGIKAIGASANAMKMLSLAADDLQKAEILGECMLAVPMGSERIPCCDSHQISADMGTR